MEELVRKIIRLWDPFNLVIFPNDEYDSYATSIYEFICNQQELTEEQLTDFVHALFYSAMSEKNNINSSDYICLDEMERASSKRFSELYFAIIKK